ncbi:DUF4358 domain-containing protein [uncultured Flavonifractor sp.]|uniref:DUF4358 domain-containing protein n=1 Tax=uncultured Flavonifractor sp. TaxID=1193534 RepID=UPI001749CBA8|nr:DUF4358 domain-containing protein [uncultured Flavonifractor sp.]
MKKIGTLALTLALAGSLTVPALAAEETAVPISAGTGYGTALVLNGETLDLTGIPGVEGGTLLPLRLLAEADHGSAYWDEENNESWFYFGDNRITVKFADNSVWVDDEQVKSQAYVTGGVTFVEAGVLEMLEGYTAEQAENGSSITITTPNNDPMVKAAYQIMEDSGMAYAMRTEGSEAEQAFQLPEGSFEQVIAFTSMNTTPDTLVLGKLAEGADEEAVKAALDAHRQAQHDTFSWYLSQNLPKVEDARILVENGYAFYLIAENADAGEAAFHAYVEAQTQA